ncbi:MAG: hypothetical protein R3B68_07110 [Phycisphaerales bacterium]
MAEHRDEHEPIDGGAAHEDADVEVGEEAPDEAFESEPDEDEEDVGPPASVLEPGTSRLAPRWWLKTLGFAIVLLGFGAWGLYDALVVYPERGRLDAERKQLEYLRSWSSGGRLGQATIADPAAELASLRERSRAGTQNLGEMDQKRLVWLEALSRIGHVSPEHTTIENPGERLGTLEREWTTRTAPAPLAAYDIPAQWLFVAIGFSIGPWLLFKFVRVAGKRYSWEPEGQRLTVPGGHVVTPGDLEDVDKRRWDKFIVFLKIKQQHSGLGGQEVKVDLYHYGQAVEDWVLAMERTAFPDRAEEDEDEDAESDEAETDDAGEDDLEASEEDERARV